LDGVVGVNGKIVENLATQVDLENDQITFRSRLLIYEPYTYYLLNKPKGYITTASDPYAGKTVFDLLPRKLVSKTNQKGTLVQRVFAVGRLDKDSMGLLLFTNDGDLAHKLSHPRYQVGKWYEVRLDRAFDARDKSTLLKGIRLREGIATVKQIKTITKRVLHVLICEGKNREVRRVFEHLEYEVVELIRIAYASLLISGLKLGDGRYLNKSEVESLREIVAKVPERFKKK
jgi:23S rRNA pseudouridine2605 synthase